MSDIGPPILSCFKLDMASHLAQSSPSSQHSTHEREKAPDNVQYTPPIHKLLRRFAFCKPNLSSLLLDTKILHIIILLKQGYIRRPHNQSGPRQYGKHGDSRQGVHLSFGVI